MARNALSRLRHQASLSPGTCGLIFGRLIATESLSTSPEASGDVSGASQHYTADIFSQWYQWGTHQNWFPAGVDVIHARLRHEEGSRAAVRMRRGGRTPGILFSLPGDASVLVSMETKHLNTLVRPLCPCSPFNFEQHFRRTHLTRLVRGDEVASVMQLRKHERSGLLSQIFSLHLERDEDGASPAVFPVLVRTCCLPVI